MPEYNPGDLVLIREPSLKSGFDFPATVVSKRDEYRYDVRLQSGEVVDVGAGNMRRPSNPWQKIMRAAARGTGLRLTAEEAWRLSQDDAIAQAATQDRITGDPA